MRSKPKSRSLVLIVTSIFSLLFLASAKSASDITKAIESEASKLDLKDYTDDAIFMQTVDLSQNISRYKSESNETSMSFTLQNIGNDKGKTIIVVPAQSPSHRKPLSNVFVVLRIIPTSGTTRTKYYAVYAYARNAPFQNTTTPTTNTTTNSIYIEWDTWEYRDGNIFGRMIDCSASLIAACDHNTTLDVPRKAYVPPSQSELNRPFRPLSPLKFGDGVSIQNDEGVFSDLEDSPSRARRLGNIALQVPEEKSTMSGRGITLLGSGGLIKTDRIVADIIGKPWGKPYSTKTYTLEFTPGQAAKPKHSRYHENTEFYIAVTRSRQRRLGDGSTRIEKTTEYVPCKAGDCGDTYYIKICNNGVCEMRLAQQEAESSKIYKLIWVTQGEKKIKKYVSINIYLRTCPECSEFRQAFAQEDVSSFALYTMQKSGRKTELVSGKLVEMDTDEYVRIDEDTLANLYRRTCPKKLKFNDDECEMKPLLLQKDSSTEPTQSNGEYTLFLRIPKTGKQRNGATVINYEYKPAQSNSLGPFYTKTCNNARICSWEVVAEPNGTTGFYKLITIRRKIKTTTGETAQEEILRFQASPLPPETKIIYIKFCYPSLSRCVLKPYDNYAKEVNSGKEFFRLVIVVRKYKHSDSEIREETEYQYNSVRIFKKDCDDAGICNFNPVASADVVRNTDFPLFLVAHNTAISDKLNFIPITPSVRLELYSRMCSSGDKDKLCGMRPVVDKGQVKVLYREVEPQRYVPTHIFRKVCNVTDSCHMQLLITFDNRILLDRTKLYILITETKPDGRIVNDFELISPSESFYEKYCEQEECGIRVIVADSSNVIYKRIQKPKTEDTYEAVKIYGRVCRTPSDCHMIELTGDSSELKSFRAWFILKSIDEDPKNAGMRKAEYILLKPDDINKLYRRVCSSGGACIMKSLVEDQEHTYYLLEGKPKKPGVNSTTPSQEYVPINIFAQKCYDAINRNCSMKPLKQTDNPWTNTLYQLGIQIPASGKIVKREYNPILPEEKKRLYRKTCGILTKGKCSFYPLFESDIVISTSDKKSGLMSRKYSPFFIYRRNCPTAITFNRECTMVPLLASDDPYIKLYETQDKLGSAPDVATDFILFEPPDKTAYYKRKCNGPDCNYIPLFANEINAVRRIPDPNEIVPLFDSKKVVPVNIQRRSCKDGSTCEFYNLKITEDPRDFELYEVTSTPATASNKQVVRRYEPLLSDYNPNLFRKSCSDGVCTYEPFFPEHSDSFYKKTTDEPNRISPRYIPALLYKKICKTGDRKAKTTVKGCEMKRLLFSDNPMTFDIFEKVNTKEGAKVVRRYNPIVPEIDLSTYFQKVCPKTAKSVCAMKPFHESYADTFFRHVVRIGPSTRLGATRNETLIQYEPIRIYTKQCKKNQTCEFIVSKPSDEIRGIPLYELRITKEETRQPNTNKSITFSRKTFKLLLPDIIYELFVQTCPNPNECIYAPIVADYSPILRKVPTTDENEILPKFTPFRVYKSTCNDTNSDKIECKMVPVRSDDEALPDDLYIEYRPIGEVGPPKTRTFMILTPEEESFLYIRICPEGTLECLRPLRTDIIYEMTEIRPIDTIPKPSNGTTISEPDKPLAHSKPKTLSIHRYEYNPINVYKSVCTEEGKDCRMSRFRIPSDDPNCKQMFKISSTSGKREDGRDKFSYIPIAGQSLNKLYIKSCRQTRSSGSIQETGCQLVPIFEPVVYSRRIIKKLKDLPGGEIEEERREEISPVYPYVQSDNPACKMKIITAEDELTRDGIYELPSRTGIPTDEISITEKFYPMEPDDVERLHKKICNGDGHCSFEPVFPKLFYEWRVFKIKDVTYLVQFPIQLYKNPKKCKPEDITEKCLVPLAPEDDIDGVEIYKLVLTRKKVPESVKSEPFHKKFVVIPPDDHYYLHRKVCNKAGFCAPKKLIEKKTDDHTPVYKLMPVTTTTPQNGTITQEQYVPIKIFRRPTNSTKMIRLIESDGPIEEFPDPIYYEITIIRKRVTKYGEIEERINKFIQLTPETADGIVIRKCAKKGGHEDKTNCTVVPILDTKPIIYKKVVKIIKKVEVVTYQPVNVYKCKPSKTKKCTMERISPKDNLDDPKSPIYMLVIIKGEKRLVRIKTIEPEELYYKITKTSKMEPVKSKRLPTSTTTTTPSPIVEVNTPSTFVEVPSDTSIEVDIDIIKHQIKPKVEDDPEVIDIPTEEEPVDPTTIVLPVVPDVPTITEQPEEDNEPTDRPPLEELITEEEFEFQDEVDEYVGHRKQIGEEYVVIVQTKVMVISKKRKQQIEIDLEDPLETDVVERVPRPTPEVIYETEVIEAQPEQKIKIERPKPKVEPKITEEDQLIDTIIEFKPKIEATTTEKIIEVEVITRSPVDLIPKATTEAEEPMIEIESDLDPVLGEKIKTIVEQKVMFEIAEPPIVEDVFKTLLLPVQGEIILPITVGTTVEPIMLTTTTEEPITEMAPITEQEIITTTTQATTVEDEPETEIPVDTKKKTVDTEFDPFGKKKKLKEPMFSTTGLPVIAVTDVAPVRITEERLARVLVDKTTEISQETTVEPDPEHVTKILSHQIVVIVEDASAEDATTLRSSKKKTINEPDETQGKKKKKVSEVEHTTTEAASVEEVTTVRTSKKKTIHGQEDPQEKKNKKLHEQTTTEDLSVEETTTVRSSKKKTIDDQEDPQGKKKKKLNEVKPTTEDLSVEETTTVRAIKKKTVKDDVDPSGKAKKKLQESATTTREASEETVTELLPVLIDAETTPAGGDSNEVVTEVSVEIIKLGQKVTKQPTTPGVKRLKIERVEKVCREETTLDTDDGHKIIFVTEIEETPTGISRRPLTELIIVDSPTTNYTIHIPKRRTPPIDVTREIRIYFKSNLIVPYEIPGTTEEIETPEATITFTEPEAPSRFPLQIIIITKETTIRTIKYNLPKPKKLPNGEEPEWLSIDQSTTSRPVTARKNFIFQTTPSALNIIFKVRMLPNHVIHIVEKVTFQTPSENVSIVLPSRIETLRPPALRLVYQPPKTKPLIFEFPGLYPRHKSPPFRVPFESPTRTFFFDIPENSNISDVTVALETKPSDYLFYPLPSFRILSRNDILLGSPEDRTPTTHTVFMSEEQGAVTLITGNPSKPNLVTEMIFESPASEIYRIKLPWKPNLHEYELLPDIESEPLTFEFPENTEIKLTPDPTDPQIKGTTIEFFPKGKESVLFTVPNLRPRVKEPLTIIPTKNKKLVVLKTDKFPTETVTNVVVTQITLETPAETVRFKFPSDIPELPIVLKRSSPEGHITTFEIPIDVHNPKLITAQGQIFFEFDPVDDSVIINFIPSVKPWTKILPMTNTYSLIGITRDRRQVHYFTKNPKNPGIERIGFVILDPISRKPGTPFYVDQIIFQGNFPATTIDLPSKFKSDPKTLEVVFEDPSNTKEALHYILPGFIDTPPDAKAAIFDTPQLQITIQYPKSIGIKFNGQFKATNQKFLIGIPKMSRLDKTYKRNPKGRYEITYKNVDKQSITLVTTGEPDDPSSTPSEVVELIFYRPDGSEVIVPFVDDPTVIGTSLQLSHFDKKTQEIVLYEFPGVSMFPNRKDNTIKFVPAALAGVEVTFDIPKKGDELRSGVIFSFKEGENKYDIEIPGFGIRGSMPIGKPIPMDITFTTVDDRDVIFRTVLPPGQTKVNSTTTYRIRYIEFNIKGKNISIKVSKPIAPSPIDPTWLHMRQSDDTETLNFELPGVKADPNGRRRKLRFNSPNGQLLMIVPAGGDNHVGIEFKVTPPGGEEVHYKLPGFIQVTDGGQSGIQKSSIEEDFNLGRSSIGPAKFSQKLPFYHPGWKLQFQNASQHISFEHEADIFYGIGNCPYSATSDAQLNQTKSNAEVISFYLRVMRTDCLVKRKDYVQSLITAGFLSLQDKEISVTPKLPQLSKLKLSIAEGQKLASSFEMDAFTRTYVSEVRLFTKFPNAPDTNPISRSAFFLTEMSLTYIVRSLDMSPRHFIRLSRHLVATLRVTFTKLLQDRHELAGCGGCGEDLRINRQDQIQVMGLMQFIMHGLQPVEQGRLDVDEAFKQFYIHNKDALEARVTAY